MVVDGLGLHQHAEFTAEVDLRHREIRHIVPHPIGSFPPTCEVKALMHAGRVCGGHAHAPSTCSERDRGTWVLQCINTIGINTRLQEIRKTTNIHGGDCRAISLHQQLNML